MKKKEMLNSDVIRLVKAGIGEVTSRTLDDGDAYLVYRFKAALLTAFGNICADERRILSECGIADLRRTLARKAELERGDGGQELDGIASSLERAQGLVSSMHSDVTSVPCCPLPYASWRALQRENARDGGPSPLEGELEILLHGVLWADPESEETSEKSTN